MDNWVEVFACDVNLLSLENFGQVHPVVLFLFKFETVVELVHFNLIGVVPLKNLRKNPAIGEISFRVTDFVCQI